MTCKPTSIFHLVNPERVRRIAMAMAGPTLARLELDEEDFLQEVYARLLRADQAPRSRYDPTRGRSPASYVRMVARSTLINHLASARRRRRASVPTDPASLAHEEAEDERITRAMTERLLSALDLDEEREAAMLLAGGYTVLEMARAMGIRERDASELRTRVRALLLPVADEIRGEL